MIWLLLRPQSFTTAFSRSICRGVFSCCGGEFIPPLPCRSGQTKGRSGAVALRTTLWFASASEVTDGGSITIPVVSASSRGCLRLGDPLNSVTTPHGTEGRHQFGASQAIG